MKTILIRVSVLSLFVIVYSDNSQRSLQQKVFYGTSNVYEEPYELTRIKFRAELWRLDAGILKREIEKKLDK